MAENVTIPVPGVAVTQPPMAVKRLEGIKANTQGRPENNRVLVAGQKGAGKTSLLKTARRPVLLYSFDPSGELVLFEKGAGGEITCPPWLFVRNGYSAGDAAAWQKFQSDFTGDLQSGVFKRMGTVAFDTLTTMADCLCSWILQEAAHTRMDKQDFGTLLQQTGYYIRRMLQEPVDFTLLAHCRMDVDEISGMPQVGLLMSGQSADRIPTWFSEVYYIKVEQSLDPKVQPKRWLLTRPDGRYPASSRLADIGGYATKEPPDLKALYRKAGMPGEDVKED